LAISGVMQDFFPSLSC